MGEELLEDGGINHFIFNSLAGETNVSAANNRFRITLGKK